MSRLIEVEAWAHEGNMLINTSALEPTHPKHPYNQILAMGLQPEEYGVIHPYTEEFQDKSRAELIQEIIDLRAELTAYARHF